MAGKTHRIGPSLIDTAKAFASEENCHAYLEAARWPNGVRCLKCDHDKVSKFTVKGKARVGKDGEVKRGPDRFMYQCLNSGCKYQFQTTTGTIFSDTHLPLSKWMMAVALMCNAKKGLSAKQMERDLGVSYKTAWFLCHRIRKAMADDGELDLMTGTIEMDETYVGGRHDKRRKRGAYDKDMVFGMIQRGGDVRAWHVPTDGKFANITNKIEENVSREADLIATDESRLYAKLKNRGFNHGVVRHSVDEYVKGDIHTQSIENFWSLFKRGLIGSFHQVSIKHLNRYLGEFCFRFNSRMDQEIFNAIIVGLVIKGALRYKYLTGPTDAELAASFSSEEPF